MFTTREPSWRKRNELPVNDFELWLSSDRKMARRITRLIAEIQRDPFSGIGKPEPLKGELSVAADR